MKILRKNIDLESNTVAILQIEATLKGFGSLKPFIEDILNNYAKAAAKSRPKVYQTVIDSKLKKLKASGSSKKRISK